MTNHNYVFGSSLAPTKLVENIGTAEDEWMIRQILHRGSLIAKGCQISAILAKQPIEVQENCFELGKYFYLTWQAFADLKPFISDAAENDVELNLISAPVLFHLTFDPNLYDKIIKESQTISGIDHRLLYQTIKNGPGIEKTEKLIRKLKVETIKHLQYFPATDKRQKIEDFLKDF